MRYVPSKLLLVTTAFAAGLAFSLSASAEPAKPAKPKKPEAAATTTNKPVQTSYRGADKFRTGPLYNGPDYLGDDPDPFIRMMIERDLSARYGGNE